MKREGRKVEARGEDGRGADEVKRKGRKGEKGSLKRSWGSSHLLPQLTTHMTRDFNCAKIRAELVFSMFAVRAIQ